MKTLLILLFLCLSVPSFTQSSYFLKCPPVLNQGQEGSCNAFSSGYYGMSIRYFYQFGFTEYDYNKNVFSPEYIFDLTNGDANNCWGGIGLITALNLSYARGVCLYGTLPYTDLNGCDSLNVPQYAKDSAAKYRMAAYDIRVLKTDRTKIKNKLLSNHPMSVGLWVDNSFVSAGKGFVWNSATESAGAAPHGVCLVGFDDNKQAYRVVSSWGTNWADSGFAWIDYTFFDTSQKVGLYLTSIDSFSVAANPVANAGSDQTINLLPGQTLASITISGSGTGTGLKYSWKDLANNYFYPVQNIFVQKPAGNWLFELTVTDAYNLTAKDTMQVKVIESSQVYKTTALLTVKGKTLYWTITTNDKLISATLYKNGSQVKTSTLLSDNYTGGTGTYQVEVTCQNSKATSNTVTISGGKKVVGQRLGMYLLKE